MKQFIRDYLTFNKRERNGLFVLITIITLMLVYLGISPNFSSSQTVDFSQFEKDIKQFNASSERVPLLSSSGDEAEVNQYEVKPTDSNIERFDFDPNHLSIEEWKRLGLNDKQIKVIQNYEAKGGKFLNKNDLKKMYCIPEKQYLSLESYISIPETENNFHPFPKNKNESLKPKKIILELNSADSLHLISLNGIGGFYAHAILKYKAQLGGFYSTKQLLEIWKFDENKLISIENKITIDTTQIKKININSCDGKQLKHPYLKWSQVNGVINYRNKHGRFQSVVQIKNTDLIDETTFGKISHYLIVE
jgi:DNA uptake protein ComE-like DNA-binding protein